MISIRELAPNEFEFFTDMFYESIHIPENKPPKDELINAPHLRKYHEGWGRAGDCALLAFLKNKPVGAAWYRLFEEDHRGYGYVDANTPELGIALTEKARGGGVGTMLMQAIIQHARENGYPALSLSVDPENRSAVHVYEKLGFRECGGAGTSITMVLGL